jgi:hypothetical protein
MWPASREHDSTLHKPSAGQRRLRMMMLAVKEGPQQRDLRRILWFTLRLSKILSKSQMRSQRRRRM